MNLTTCAMVLFRANGSSLGSFLANILVDGFSLSLALLILSPFLLLVLFLRRCGLAWIFYFLLNL